jgi:hypothetical protein
MSKKSDANSKSGGKKDQKKATKKGKARESSSLRIGLPG